MSVSDRRVQRHSVEGLRSSDAATLAVLVPEALRLHIERVEPSCVADLFALAELALPGSIGQELGVWAARATREIRDLPDGDIRLIFVQEIGELAPELVPQRLRDAVLALEGNSSAATANVLHGLAASWAEAPPTRVVLPAPKARAATAPTSGRATTVATAVAQKKAAPKVARAPKAARTPAAMVDPRRAEWIREDAIARLGSREYQERGLKESIFLAGIRHRGQAQWGDMTDEEIKVELRKLERERKLKHTGERWTIR